MTVKSKANGMFRRGLCVSSPRVAAPSNPPNDKMQKTIAKPNPDQPP
jgi:hypothetical protein